MDEWERDCEWLARRADVAQWERGQFPEGDALPTAADANDYVGGMKHHEDPSLRDSELALRPAHGHRRGLPVLIAEPTSLPWGHTLSSNRPCSTTP